jgi:hypothetical protein
MSGLWQGLADSSYRKSGWAFIVTSLLLAAAISVYPAPKNQPEICAYLPILRVTLGGALLLGAGTTFLALRRKHPRLMIGAIAISSTIFLLGVNAGAGSFDKASTEKLAKILKPMLKPEDRVYSVGFYCQDLPPYLERLVSVVDYRGELAFGIDAEPEITSKRFLDRDGFVSQWAEPGTAYAVVRKSYYDKWFPVSSLPYDVIAQTNRFVLVVKRNSQP